MGEGNIDPPVYQKQLSRWLRRDTANHGIISCIFRGSFDCNSGLFHYSAGVFVVAQGYEFRVAQMIGHRPLQELNLSHRNG
jgi:hypothetical protein